MKKAIKLINAVLKGKARGFEYTEDSLTSTVFGTLQYIELYKGIVPFIENSILYDDEKTTLWKALKKDDIDIRCFQQAKLFFWTKHSKYGEPDLIIIFTDHAHGEDDLLIIVEAKFKSDKSGTGEYDQLMRYYKAVCEDIENFNDFEIAGFTGRKGYIVYLTESEAVDQIKDSIAEIKKTDQNYKDKIFHLRWHQLHTVLSHNVQALASREKLIALDLIKYLEKLGLSEFRGVSAPSERIIKLTSYYGAIFYQDSKAVREKDTFFDQLPEVKLDKLPYCFYRGN